MPLSDRSLSRRFGFLRMVNRKSRKWNYLIRFFLNPYYEAEENAGNMRPSDAARIWITQEQKIQFFCIRL